MYSIKPKIVKGKVSAVAVVVAVMVVVVVLIVGWGLVTILLS